MFNFRKCLLRNCPSFFLRAVSQQDELVILSGRDGFGVQLRAKRVRGNGFHEKFTPVQADVAAAWQERSIIRQAYLRTLSAPHW